MSEIDYRGRFAPSPSGLLHAGSLATALGSWLAARAANGRWVIRIEDLDTPRNQAGADLEILRQLDLFGLRSDEPVVWQSKRISFYEKALENLIHHGLCYPCACSRKDIEANLARQGIQRQRHTELIYPGTCRSHPQGINHQTCAWRAKLPPNTHIGGQDLNHQVGDFVLKRADGIFSYQLTVVVDDFLQGITHIVRGADLLDNTPRQLWLQEVLGYPHPNYIHLPLVVNQAGEKLSKQTHAPELNPKNDIQVIELLHQAGKHLGLILPEPIKESSLSKEEWLEQAMNCWREQKSTTSF